MKENEAGEGRILFMDDNEMIRKSISRMLSLNGYEVELACDGIETIEKYIKAREAGLPFDAVVLDLTVNQGIGGEETVKRLLEIDQDVKAIVSSGYTDEPIMRNFKDYGFSGAVPKPFDIEKLEETLQELIKE